MMSDIPLTPKPQPETFEWDNYFGSWTFTDEPDPRLVKGDSWVRAFTTMFREGSKDMAWMIELDNSAWFSYQTYTIRRWAKEKQKPEPKCYEALRQKGILVSALVTTQSKETN